MRFPKSSHALIALSLLSAAPASAQTVKDMTVVRLVEMNYYGQDAGYYAYSFGTTSCNEGNVPLAWLSPSGGQVNIAQNIFRLHNGRFEQIGQSWLKHGFTALQGNTCGCGCSSAASARPSPAGAGRAPRWWWGDSRVVSIPRSTSICRAAGSASRGRAWTGR